MARRIPRPDSSRPAPTPSGTVTRVAVTVGGAVVWNGTTQDRKYFNNSSNQWSNFPANYDPTAATSFAFILGFEFNLTGSGTASSAGNSGADCSLRTTVTDNQLLADTVNGASAAVISSYSNRTVIGAWWTSTTNAGLQYVYIRCPYYNNRLRIHGLRVMQIE